MSRPWLTSYLEPLWMRVVGDPPRSILECLRCFPVSAFSPHSPFSSWSFQSNGGIQA